MVISANVMLWGQFVGALRWNEALPSVEFEFDADFARRRLDIAPLTMPFAKGVQVYDFRNLPWPTFQGLPGLLADSLPDTFGNSLLDAWLIRHGRTAGSLTPLEKLCYQGKRGMGALEFEPALLTNSGSAITLDVTELVGLATAVLTQRQEVSVSDAALAELMLVGTSAGGMRAKAVVAYNEATGELRSGQVQAPEGFLHWLLKFDGVSEHTLGDPAGFGRIEYAYHLMALAAGVEMMPSRLSNVMATLTS